MILICAGIMGFIGKIYSEMFPLTMPYMPSNKSDVIVCDELLTDRKNGDLIL